MQPHPREVQEGGAAPSVASAPNASSLAALVPREASLNATEAGAVSKPYSVSRSRTVAANVSSGSMADEIRELNNEDLEGVAGGKVTIRVPFSTTRLRQLIADAENNGESLDWVLQQIDADDQRKWVRREWEKTHRG